MLSSGGSAHHGDDPAADTDRGKGAKPDAPLGPKLSDCRQEPYHSFLDQILAVSPCQKEGAGTGPDQAGVTQDQGLFRSAVTLSGAGAEALVCDITVVFEFRIHILFNFIIM